ncbi:MAG: hypothetical protein R3272_01890 [Candidatus Promineifilaceae bacterium]|nr:hypothetical protein [Candidatus Promineifilaceae bacterium]
MAETQIVSFVLRFLQEQQVDGGAPWRGVIRHVQSREELHFGTMEEAMQFIGGYVALEHGIVPSAAPEGEGASGA